MGAKEAVQFLIDDHGDKNPMSGFRKDFAEDKPYKSLLQRQGKTLEEVLEIFDWKPDDNEWNAEYKKKEAENYKLVMLRRRICFAIGGWRELNEDFGRGDVSCLRELRNPFVTSRSPLKAAKDEFNEQQ